MIQGKQVILRDGISEDLASVRKWDQPGQEWQRLDGPYYSRGTPEEIERNLERVAARIEQGEWPEPRIQLIVADATTNAFVGRVTRYWQSEETNWLSAGVVIFDPAHWRRGIGFEALGLWSQYLFESMPELVRLDLRTWSGNHGMMRLAEKLGYQLEARFRQARIVEGDYYDGLGYGVLREEWDARYPTGFSSGLGS